MLDKLINLDRRWVFLAMFLAVAVPVLLQPDLPEAPTPMVRTVFNAVEDLPEGSRVFFSLDYDPASQPELGPMTRAITRHAAMKGHKLYYATLWPLGSPMIDEAIGVLNREFEHYQYGEDYVNLGYAVGFEVAIQLMVADLAMQFPVDSRGHTISEYPMFRQVRNLRDVDLVVSIGAGYPGTKEWVQFAATPNPEMKLVGGVTGVSAPPLYPYIPTQLIGMLPAIKGAAEYEAALAEAYPRYKDDRRAKSAIARMGPQLSAHILMLVLIVLGNVIFFIQRRRGGGR